MNTPTMMDPYAVAEDPVVLSGYFPIPTLGVIPSNAFVIRVQEPVLAAGPAGA